MRLQKQAQKDRHETQWRADKNKSTVEWLSGLIDSVELLLLFLIECSIFFFPGLPSLRRRWSNTSRCMHGVLKLRKRLIGVDGIVDQHRIQHRDAEYDYELTHHWI